MKKLRNTEAKFKKRVAYEKKTCTDNILKASEDDTIFHCFSLCYISVKSPKLIQKLG